MALTQRCLAAQVLGQKFRHYFLIFPGLLIQHFPSYSYIWFWFWGPCHLCMRFPFCPWSVLWKPSHCPSMPPGFGTGHSLLERSDAGSAYSSVVCSNCTMPSGDCGVSGVMSRRLHLLRLPFSSTTTSPSAYLARGTGQGNKCGSATTKKLAMTVVANRDEVMRDLGWRCGGIWSRKASSVRPDGG